MTPAKPARGTVVLPEPMTRFRCNERGCCCQGWTIPFTPSDVLRLSRLLPEEEVRDRLQERVRILDRDESGDVTRLVLIPVGEDRRCRFLREDLRCELHGRFGVAALPNICVNFPAVPYVAGDQVEMYFSLVCPEVLVRLSESEEPYRIVRLQSSETSAVADRARTVAGTRSVSFDGIPISWERLAAVRETILLVLADPSRPVLEAVADISFALGRVRESGDLDRFSVPREADRGAFYEFFAHSVRSHQARVLHAQLLEYRRFVFDLPDAQFGPELVAALDDWEPHYRRWVLPAVPEWLLRRYLAHRYFTVFSSGEGTLHFSYGSIVHAFALACRLMAGLCGACRRPVDVPIAKAALGSSEYFNRMLALNVPKAAFPWFRPDEPGFQA